MGWWDGQVGGCVSYDGGRIVYLPHSSYYTPKLPKQTNHGHWRKKLLIVEMEEALPLITSRVMEGETQRVKERTQH